MNTIPTRDKLLEALKPFAEEAETWPAGKKGSYDDSYVPLSVHYTVGDLRRAAEAYAALEAASTDGEGFVRVPRVALENWRKARQTIFDSTNTDTGYVGMWGEFGIAEGVLMELARALSPAPASKGPMEAEIERVAKAIAKVIGDDDWEKADYFINQADDTIQTTQDLYRDLARAALGALTTSPPVE